MSRNYTLAKKSLKRFADHVTYFLTLPWKYDREGDATFFFLRFLFIWANVSFYIINYFLMLWNQSVFRIFCRQSLFQLLRVRGKRNKKVWFDDNFLHFPSFQTFENLEIEFDIFYKLSILSELGYFLAKILTNYKKDLKHVVTMTLQ